MTDTRQKITQALSFTAARAGLQAALISLLFSACTQLPVSLPEETGKARPAPPVLSDKVNMYLKPLAFKDVPMWKADLVREALPTFLKSCAKLVKKQPTDMIGPMKQMGTVADWLPICASARLVRLDNEAEARIFFETRFRPYLIFNGTSSTGLITGYYEPELRGSWHQDANFRYPLYTRPKDIKTAELGQFDPSQKGTILAGQFSGDKFIPYHSRADIEAGILAGRQLELMWVDDPIDAFFLHIQGSGRVIMPDGSTVRVGFSGRNGRPYRAIGGELINSGIMTPAQVSMQSIRSWIRNNVLQGRQLMMKNESYIFFRVVEGDGPLGSQGVVLTPERSIAVDRSLIPLGIPVWIKTTLPGSTLGAKDLVRLTVSQDTGSAIKGPLRADYFWGFGGRAGEMAGHMKQAGQLYLLLPANVDPNKI